jgi:hypothetical protein
MASSMLGKCCTPELQSGPRYLISHYCSDYRFLSRLKNIMFKGLLILLLAKIIYIYCVHALKYVYIVAWLSGVNVQALSHILPIFLW